LTVGSTSATLIAASTRRVPMSKVYCSAVVPGPVQEVWKVVRDFNGLPDWHPMVTDSAIEDGLPSDVVGCVRSFHFTDGDRLRERLLALSDLDHSCAYTIVEAPLPLDNYLSEVRLRRVTADETTFVEWVGQFDAADADEADACNTIMTFYHNGLEALRERFARS
jgi:hypothetical protein